MKAYKRMSKGTWALLIASTLATGGMMPIGMQAFTQGIVTSSLVAQQTQEQSSQESDKGRTQVTSNKNATAINITYDHAKPNPKILSQNK